MWADGIIAWQSSHPVQRVKLQLPQIGGKTDEVLHKFLRVRQPGQLCMHDRRTHAQRIEGSLNPVVQLMHAFFDHFFGVEIKEIRFARTLASRLPFRFGNTALCHDKALLFYFLHRILLKWCRMPSDDGNAIRLRRNIQSATCS
jgi:hypothetical protein